MVELLVVLVIVGIAAGLTGPAMYQVYDKVSALIQRNEVMISSKITGYNAFIRETECEVRYFKENSRYVFTCDGRPFDEIRNIGRVTSAAIANFNHKGFEVVD